MITKSLVVLLSLLVALRSPAQTTFIADPPVAIGNSPAEHAALVDIDGDGDLDLFTIARASSTARVLLNDGAANFTLITILATGPFPEAVSIADLDGDGDAEVVTRNFGTVTVFCNTTFSLPSTTYAAALPLGDIELVDVDGDGRLDIWFRSGQVMIQGASASGVGAFSAPVAAGPVGNFSSVRTFDLEGDGDTDFFALDIDDVLHIFRNDGGPLTATTMLDAGNAFARPGDLDGDGVADFVVPTDPVSGGFAGALMTYTGDGSGGFMPGEDIAFDTPDFVYLTPTLRDLNDDDRDDLALALRPMTGAQGHGVSVYLSSPGDGFAPSNTAPFNASATTGVAENAAAPTGLTFTLGDVDGDDHDDLVLTGVASGSAVVAVVHRQQPPTRRLVPVTGTGQSALVGTSFPLPLIVRYETVDGIPLVGETIVFTDEAPNATVTTPSSTTTTTDAAGLATVTLQASAIAGTDVVVVSATDTDALPIAFAVLPDVTLTLVEGDDQASNIGETLRDPIVVRATDVNSGLPRVGITVEFDVISTSSGMTTCSSSTTTDTTGLATTSVIAPIERGAFTVIATSPNADPETPVIVDAFARRLDVSFEPIVGTLGALDLEFLNDRAGVPLLVAIDTPLPPPGFLSTVYGDIHTSIFSPGPTFGALDGIGVFGPPNPGIVAGPNFGGAFVIDAAPLAGMTFVFQVYGFDASRPFPAAVIASNPENVGF